MKKPAKKIALTLNQEREVARLRDEGMKFHDIARELSVDPEDAYVAYQEWMREHGDAKAASVRVARTLRKALGPDHGEAGLTKSLSDFKNSVQWAKLDAMGDIVTTMIEDVREAQKLPDPAVALQRLEQTFKNILKAIQEHAQNFKGKADAEQRAAGFDAKKAAGLLAAVKKVAAGDFWKQINQQIEELETAGSAADVFRICPPTDSAATGSKGFFAGSGGDQTVAAALRKAGWKTLWAEAPYHWCKQAPNGDTITYVEGDIYKGNSQSEDRQAKAVSKLLARAKAAGVSANKPEIRLTSRTMGENATEDDFDSWAQWVADHITEAIGIEADEVEQYPWGRGPDEDRVTGVDEDTTEAIRRWLSVEGWEAFCAEGGVQ